MFFSLLISELIFQVQRLERFVLSNLFRTTMLPRRRFAHAAWSQACAAWISDKGVFEGWRSAISLALIKRVGIEESSAGGMGAGLEGRLCTICSGSRSKFRIYITNISAWLISSGTYRVMTLHSIITVCDFGWLQACTQRFCFFSSMNSHYGQGALHVLIEFLRVTVMMLHFTWR